MRWRSLRAQGCPSPACCPVTWYSPPPDRCHSAYWPPPSAVYSLHPQPWWTLSDSEKDINNLHETGQDLVILSTTNRILNSVLTQNDKFEVKFQLLKLHFNWGKLVRNGLGILNQSVPLACIQLQYQLKV